MVPSGLRYTSDHEWARLESDNLISVGVTDFAQDALGDITFVELPQVGDRLSAGDAFGVIESVKTFSDLYAPVDGEVVECNFDLEGAPEGINEDPYGAWLIKLRVEDPSVLDGLMDAETYTQHALGES